MRPLVLLDVDGPLNPWAGEARPPGYVPHDLRLSGRWWACRTLRVHLNPEHGRRLLDFAARTGAELAWASTWEHRANTMIGPALGLPTLEVVEFAASDTWKYGPVARYAYGRPLAWFDDDFALHETAREAFLERRRGLPTELIHVDPATGLTEAHWAALEAFAGHLRIT
ncbi:hypothetical protein Lesp02_56190 [Lentzea sp. NBRC 105346]|uniref:HAD domain-containing protein n=1 Tax=Lentzea sp. NBRC 105346 TaxID=3032205 RepID=UPI0024A30520|nr:HAD domain-containing protein [Lentzea sp. NBRC 105346]GLZ33431.1 hypothetical protein Lesp02_56190 [Lentzea sp. NBRC 105346]